MIISSINQSVNNDRSVMVLTERKEHIELLAKIMTDKGIKVVELHGGISVVRVLMDQHKLNTTDFKNEIGGKSMVSMILNNKRKLSLEHIKALSSRFSIPLQLFI